MIKEIIEENEKATISSTILHALPEWFALPESTKQYITNSRNLTFFAYIEDHHPLGFIALKETSPHTVEIYVMGVLKDFHKKGIGKKLFIAAEEYARDAGYSFMQVKTVKEGIYPEYDITNHFYQKMGFLEFECIPDLWDEWNPCQIYIKSLLNLNKGEILCER